MLQVKTTDKGTVTLELTFDPHTENRLRNETFHNADEKALTFKVEATNLKTTDTKIMKYKGCVTRVHCIPLDINFVKGDEYSIVVDVHKFCPHSGAFTCFLERQVNYRRTEHTFVRAPHNDIQLHERNHVDTYARNSVENHCPLLSVEQFHPVSLEATTVVPLLESPNFLPEQSVSNPCLLKKHERLETDREQKQQVTTDGLQFLHELEQEAELGISFLQEEEQQIEGLNFLQEQKQQVKTALRFLQELQARSGFTFLQEEEQEVTTGLCFPHELEQQETTTTSGLSFLHEEEQKQEIGTSICFLQEDEKETQSGHSFLQEEHLLGK